MSKIKSWTCKYCRTYNKEGTITCVGCSLTPLVNFRG